MLGLSLMRIFCFVVLYELGWDILGWEWRLCSKNNSAFPLLIDLTSRAVPCVFSESLRRASSISIPLYSSSKCITTLSSKEKMQVSFQPSSSAPAGNAASSSGATTPSATTAPAASRIFSAFSPFLKTALSGMIPFELRYSKSGPMCTSR